MTTYKVLAPMGITIHTGKVKLNEDQARRRVHAIEPVKDILGVYVVKAPVSFKSGETFGYDGEIGKAMASELIDQSSGKSVAETRRAEDEKKRRAATEADKDETKKK